jgi:hypothetical protein
VDGAIKQKGIEAPNIKIEMEDWEEWTATLLFYMISGCNLSWVHMVVENLGATGVIPDEGGWDRRMMTGEDTSNKRCEGYDISPSSDRPMTTGEDTLERRCEDQDMSPKLDRHMTTSGDTSGEAVRAMIWATGVWIANVVAMMSMKINVGLTFMDIVSMLKVNELEDICLGQ